MTLPQLYTQSAYTLLQSTLSIEKMVTAAKSQGYEALALTDYNVLTASVEFANACKKNGINPLFGLHLDYVSAYRDVESDILLYAKNLAGYQKLMTLSSEKMISGSVDLANFGSLADLYAVLPAKNELAVLFEQDPEVATKRLAELRQIFGSEQLFYGFSPQFMNSNLLTSWYADNEVAPCAIYQVNSLSEAELPALKVMEHLKAGTQISDMEELSTGVKTFLQPAVELQNWFAAHQQTALQNAELIAQARVEIPLHQKLYPSYPVPNGEAAASFLRRLCQENLPKRISNLTPAYQERLDYELSVIHKMGYDDYFLIVWDVMDFAHRTKIVTGPGRGSAAGSLVSYVLAITDVDPIKYDLLFERFLNPERYTMPDIDLDIPDNRREEVLHYVMEKYGRYQVAQIATFGTMAAKMVLRDTARVFGMSQSEANRWSAAIPDELKITLQTAYDKSARLRELVADNPKNERLFQVARTLEGLPRHVSTHAAGVVISDQNLVNLVPLQNGSEDILLTQFTMNDVEAIGLLKMDFLGLRNLSIIDDTLQGIKRTTGRTIDLAQIPFDDPATLKMFQKGDTTGVFQFESASARGILRQISPDNIEDIVAANSLNRPGPSQFVETFAKRKKGQQKVTYPDDSLAPILKNTYGIIVYQEQVMQVASKMAGFSLGQADILRRAMGKKKKEVLDEQRRNFVNGALNQGYPEAKANEVYDYIERFANYGFNRSHAFAYSFIGFQMGYLKVHYPGAFFTALMQSTRNNFAKIKEYLREAKQRGIQVLPPDINYSGSSFYLTDEKTIRFGLGSLKGIRRDFVFDIISERKENGPFKSLDSFLYRLPKKWLKDDLIRPLVEIGAFDQLIDNRRQSAADLESKIQNIEYSGGSIDLLGMMALRQETEAPDFNLEERLDIEEQYLGVYLSGHPADKYTKLQQFKQITEVNQIIPGKNANMLLYVRNIREIRTKKNELMAFVEGNDPAGEISVTVFPKLYRSVRSDFSVNDVIYVEGKAEISSYNQELQLIANRIGLASQMESQLDVAICYLKIAPELEKSGGLFELNQIIKKNPGKHPVILFYEKSGTKKLLGQDLQVTSTPEVRQALEDLLGKNNVVFK